MTTATAPIRHTGLQVTFRDAVAVAKRYLLHYRRQPQLLVFSTIQPIMFVLLFRYVFGGALENAPGIDNYANFLLPGIFVQSVAFGSTQTAIGLTDDLAAGVVDRFRSLPMARSAVLLGRTISDLVRGTFVVVLMAVVGVIVGFRPSLIGLLGSIVLVVGFGFAFSWLYAFVGLKAKGTETAQAASFVATFPLVFASAVFLPIETFPSWLQGFARINPITQVAQASRSLAVGIGTDAASHVLWSLAWIVGLLVVFVPLSVRAYKRS
jgi:ABC transporter DrrB family efflux protein